MRLKRLTIRGFKSFADRTEFEFDAALTGIVGPNGCGKSNVVDALKWVLGDQRAKSLRGSEMTDVIFKGAEGRDALHEAEVTITLENVPMRVASGDTVVAANGDGAEEGATADEAAAGEEDSDGEGAGDASAEAALPRIVHEYAAEVTIGRRLTKDKESEYLLNGQPVRLKDVRDVLMDTGLGVGAYSVMEQGRIDAVLSANPESRRAIFEEAAGISRFKLQKKETLRKLERTEQNLARVKDLLEERGRRIRSLKIQAGKARRFREIRERLRDLKAALAVLEAREVRARQAEVEAALEDLARELAGAEAVQAELLASREAAEAEIAAIATRVDEAQAKLHQLDGQRTSLLGKAAAQDQRRAELAQDSEDAVQRQEELRLQAAERELAVREAQERMAQLEAELIELHKALEERREAVRAGQNAVRELQAQREAARAKVLEWIHAKTRRRNLAHDQEAQIRAADGRRERIEARQAQLDGELVGLRQELTTAEARLEELTAERGSLQEQEAATLARLEALDRQAAELAREESGLQMRLSEASGRLHVLREMEAHLDGLDQGPRFLLETRPEGLRGRLLDLLDVDLAHGAALEAALGPFVQALVVDTRAHADAMLDLLQLEGRGRAILLVEEEFGAGLGGDGGLDLPPGAEYLARHVRCAENAQSLLRWLLRGVCLVPSLQEAEPGRPDLMFVTPDGALLCGPRIEGGRGEGHGGLVVRRASIQALQEEAEQLGSALGSLQAGKQELAGRVAALKEEARQLSLTLGTLGQQHQETASRQHRTAARCADLERELETLQFELADVRALRGAALAELGRHLLDAHLCARREQAYAQKEAEWNEQLTLLQAAAADAVRAEQEVRLRQVACTSDRESCKEQVRLQQQALAEIARNAGLLQARAQEAAAGAARAAEEAARCRSQVEVLDAQRDELDEERGTLAEQLTGARQRHEEVRRRLAAEESARTQLGERHTQSRLAAADLDHRFTRLEERLREETSVELRRCLGEIEGRGLEPAEPFGPPLPPDLDGAPLDCEVLLGPPLPAEMLEAEANLRRLWRDDTAFDVDAAQREAQVLDAQAERLGPVNLDAEQELVQEEEGFVFLEREVGDLNEARRALMEALRRLETESRALFERTFEVARQNFQSIFRKLFQGGRADMFLSDGADHMEAGIEIVARPPGKELQSINLLSGGERSLTALAILFGVFKVKPSPFCILDEVDAALDETNVERFLRVLQEFVGETQFCVVTHHKRTMAACQVLYGITMQKRGVSSRIAVSLDQVDALRGPETAAPETSNRLALRQRVAGEEPVGF